MANTNDIETLDQPEILNFIFHPRPEPPGADRQENLLNLSVPVETDVRIGVRFYPASTSAPTILFFHGNGEIAADYDDFFTFLKNIPVNFMVADYRGYGRSNGRPTVSSMMADCYPIFDFSDQWLTQNGYSGRRIIMGRSLGSASALALAVRHGESLAGLVLDSAFADAFGLLRRIGAPLSPEAGQGTSIMDNGAKIRDVRMPTLIIHGELDQIIPYREAQILYDRCPAPDKQLLTIKGADHNTLFLLGLSDYMEALSGFIEKISE